MNIFVTSYCTISAFCSKSIKKTSKNFFLSLVFLILFVFCAFSEIKAQQCQPGGPPQLSVVAGPGFREVTQSWTGVSGSSGLYTVHGSPDGGATWGVVQ